MKRAATKHSHPAGHTPASAAELPQTMTWEGMVEQLTGLGPVRGQLDGLRFHLSNKLRARLGDAVNRPWMMSAWAPGCLRLISLNLWPEYSRQISAHLTDDKTRSATEIILRTATRLNIDHKGRWNLPPGLVTSAGIEVGASCMVVTNQTWIEIWSFATWEKRLQEAMKIVAETHTQVEQTKVADGFPK